MPPDALPTETRPLAAQRMRAAVAPNSWNADSRTVDVVFTTGADVTRRDFWTGERWVERLEVSAEAIDLTRLNSGAPLLDTHSSYALGDVVGVVERAWVDGGKGYATVRFSERPEVAGVMRDVATGILRNISVGYMVDQWEIAEASGARAQLRTAKRWTPYELSLVPVPADAAAQVRAGMPSPPAAPAAPKESNMSDIDPAADAATRQAELDSARTEAVAAERARMADIAVIQGQARLGAEWAQQHIAAGTSVDEARAAALAEIAKAPSPRVPPQVAGVHQDEGDTSRRLLANALEHRANVPGTKLEDGARQFRGFRMVDFARASLDLSGVNHRGLAPLEIFKEAGRVHQRNQMMGRDAGGMVSGDFPFLLANTASKMLRAAYGAAPRTFTGFSSQVNLPDFKTFSAVALSDAPALAVVAEDAEITYGSFADYQEQWALVRYARALRISYVAMVNDDMSGFTRLPQMWGNAAARLEADQVYSILTTNANMADGNALIGAAHVNTTTGVLSANATGVTNVGKLQELLRKQTAPNGQILNLRLGTLLVPAALETVAAQLFAPAGILAALGAINPYTGIQIVAEPRLDATSAVAFYGFADPGQVDTIHYGYLDGEDGPTISSEIDFDTDGMASKVTHNFGAKAIDWRGIAYSTGA
jgi:hypothetical protein